MKTQITRIAAITLLAVPSVALTTGTAFASGQSLETNGCYVQWWDTAWTAKCAPADVTGDYRAVVKRSGQADYTGAWRNIGVNSTVTFDSGAATFAVQRGSYVGFKGSEA